MLFSNKKANLLVAQERQSRFIFAAKQPDPRVLQQNSIAGSQAAAAPNIDPGQFRVTGWVKSGCQNFFL